MKSVGSVVSVELLFPPPLLPPPLFPPPLFPPPLFPLPESPLPPSDEHATARTEKNINKMYLEREY